MLEWAYTGTYDFHHHASDGPEKHLYQDLELYHLADYVLMSELKTVVVEKMGKIVGQALGETRRKRQAAAFWGKVWPGFVEEVWGRAGEGKVYGGG